MLDLSFTRRQILGSASLLTLATAIPAAFHWSGARAPNMLVSAERAPPFGLWSGAVLLDGPRIARLQAMAENLPRFSGEFVLRLDATDDSLLDVAAQQAGVHIRRGAALPDGLGIRAHISSTGRSLA
ncbi:MAG: hypothetical protein J0G94_09025 [Sphingomonadales bacterium]|nr:hypothetical protein [Sphingomonadales bacterium]